jgi:cyclopropane fatty-acyl-phospholipid synthase-like methyltransferase
MLKYVMAAAALKAFSVNAFSMKIYRKIGNTFGQRQRLAVDDLDVRIERGELLVKLCRANNAVRAGDQILEIGTGWMLWYSLYLRLFYDIHVTAFDIWDNRQFLALQAAANKLSSRLDDLPSFDEKARLNLRKLTECKSFEEVHQQFGFEYVIEPNGAITAFRDGQFDLITSFHVLEHVPTRSIQQLMHDMFRKLKPGGYTIHQIGIDDHLTHYDSKASPKQYLKYSDRVWRILFENEVQYINRKQTSDWLSAFEGAGFKLVDMISASTNIDDLKINPVFRKYPREDLACTTLTIVYQKPNT